jgi:broad specificity phosphatase PhoE
MTWRLGALVVILISFKQETTGIVINGIRRFQRKRMLFFNKNDRTIGGCGVPRLIFVRHGETAWNAARRLQGQSDIALSEEGRRQAHDLRELVAGFAPDTVVASDLQRTRETSAALGFETPRLDPRLREADLGEWTGRSIEQLQAEEAENYSAWRAGAYTPPDAESWESLLERVRSAVDELLHVGGCHLIVTHGGPIRAACLHLIGLHLQHMLPVAPASATIIDVNYRPRLGAFNLTARPLVLDAPD